MKCKLKNIITILLLLVRISYAQQPGQQLETPFDKFISQPGIEWAVYFNDTISFTRYNLNKHLVDRLKHHSINASRPIASGSSQAAQVIYLKNAEIDKVLYRFDETQSLDPLGNISVIKKSASLKIDTSKITLTDAIQILYVEKGQLKSYIPWIATMTPIVTSAGIYLGDGECFSTCFNLQYKTTLRNAEKDIFLGHSNKKIIIDSVDRRNKLKELYGRNLVQTLWPLIIKGGIKVFSPQTGKLISISEINSDLVNEEKTQVPLYDSVGNLIGYRQVQEPLSPDFFSRAELEQDWYYNNATNIVYNRIRKLVLYAKKQSSGGEASVATPILKIIFP